MSWFRRLVNLIRSDRLARDIEREMKFHVAERVDELVANGMSEADARREARRRFGHRQVLKERVHNVDVLLWLESLLADLRCAHCARTRGSPWSRCCRWDSGSAPTPRSSA